MSSWRKECKEALTDPAELAELFSLDPQETARVAAAFPFRIPRYYLSLIQRKGDAIYRQCVPDVRELESSPDLLDDPLGEDEHSPVPGIVHKYPDHCLFLVSGTCAMYCRFCTRKRKFDGPRIPTGKKHVDEGVAYVQEHKEIRDVLISGGDPFLLSTAQIEYVLRSLRKHCPHVEMIRIGTRTPCVLPSRITPKLCAMLKKYHPLYVNVHFNHPDEVTPLAKKALGLLADAGIPLGSQTVLLRGVNDDPETIKLLMQKLLAARVRPYYLFQSDLVRGNGHFRTPLDCGLKIMDSLRGRTSGMALPHFAVDLPHGNGKVPLLPQYLLKREGHTLTMRTWQGKEALFPDTEEQA